MIASQLNYLQSFDDLEGRWYSLQQDFTVERTGWIWPPEMRLPTRFQQWRTASDQWWTEDQWGLKQVQHAKTGKICSRKSVAKLENLTGWCEKVRQSLQLQTNSAADCPVGLVKTRTATESSASASPDLGSFRGRDGPLIFWRKLSPLCSGNCHGEVRNKVTRPMYAKIAWPWMTSWGALETASAHSHPSII
jgi:hypothetical protein